MKEDRTDVSAAAHRPKLGGVLWAVIVLIFF